MSLVFDHHANKSQICSHFQVRILIYQREKKNDIRIHLKKILSSIRLKMDIRQGCEALELAKKIMGKKSAKINSNIYSHLIGTSDSEDNFDEAEDIIKIKAKTDAGITINDVLVAFRKMKNQFDKVNDSSQSGRSFYYEGMRYDKNTRTYNLIWGS